MPPLPHLGATIFSLRPRILAFASASDAVGAAESPFDLADGRRLGDLPEYVDADYLARVTRVNLVGLATLAWAPAPPTGVQIDARRCDPDMTHDAAVLLREPREI